MKPPRRGRRLSGEEAHLWGEVAKLITPLRGRAVPMETPAETKPDQAQLASPVREKGGTGAASPEEPGPSPQPSPAPGSGPAAPTRIPASSKRPVKLGASSSLVPARPAVPAFRPAVAPPGLERREHRGLRRGTLAIEARIDLHGLYQTEAHAALIGFLMHARASGFARVLVVTGKGGDTAGDVLSERGVLRRSVPHWLRGPELRGIVLGFEEAGRQHGGAGALYVRLKRR